MTRSAIVAEDAVRDIKETRRWYQFQGGGVLDARFVLVLETTLVRLLRFPEIYPVVHGSIRRVLLKPFPYLVFYEADERTLVVHRCIHAHSDPKRWPDLA